VPVDTNSQELQLLFRQYEKGNVVLFCGAGSSVGATNSNGKDPPMSGELSEILARECGWSYSGEELAVVYEQAMKHLGTAGLNSVLSVHYQNVRPAPWHRAISNLLWFRIYTTNIDDVLENSYAAGGAQKFLPITCPHSYEEPDIWYERVQCVHLHGSVLDFSKGFTFTFDDFARLTASPNPWYQAMVDDMQSKSFVYMGTRLNEPPFYHYLEMRSQRARGTREYRARAFLVAPTVPHIRRRQLEDKGIFVVEASAEEFLNAVLPILRSRVHGRMALLENRYPHQIAAIRSGVFNTQSELFRQFELVTAAEAPRGATAPRTLFYAGAEPTWDDIRNNNDAEREVATDFLAALRSSTSGVASFVLVGHAGSGKSTLLRRLAFEVAREGRTVYFSKSPSRIEKGPLVDMVVGLDGKHAYIFIDDAMIHLEAVEEVARELPGAANVTFVLADRPHVVYPRLRRLTALRPKLLDMPYLTRPDCEKIIEKLEETGLLGELRGKPRHEQLRAFLVRSKKQLLVAMKEATLGRGFDVILANEYQSLSGEDARLAYTVTCLAYMHGAPVRRRHLLACVQGTDIQKAALVEEDLRDVVIRWNDNPELLCPRHRVIANQVATGTAPPHARYAAITNYLAQISPDLTAQNISRRTPEYIGYRGIINFDNMLDLFGEDYETINSVYDDLKGFYSQDFLFWLQFGRAQVYFDKFDLGENYLKQSLSIREQGNFQAYHYMGVLLLKRARFQEAPSLAAADAREGEEILRHQITERGDVDPYPYAALIVHKLRYITDWQPTGAARQIEDLYHMAQVALRKHPFDDAVKDAHDQALRAYLTLAVPAEANEPGAA
jgi:energy-coupling factor transporter ATP-binding protein EcfA2